MDRDQFLDDVALKAREDFDVYDARDLARQMLDMGLFTVETPIDDATFLVAQTVEQC